MFPDRVNNHWLPALGLAAVLVSRAGFADPPLHSPPVLSEFDRRHVEAMHANETDAGMKYSTAFDQSDAFTHLFPLMSAQCPNPVSFEVVAYVSTAGRVESALIVPEGAETACPLKIITSLQGLPPPPREFWSKGYPFAIGQEVNGKSVARPAEQSVESESAD